MFVSVESLHSVDMLEVNAFFDLLRVAKNREATLREPFQGIFERQFMLIVRGEERH